MTGAVFLKKKKQFIQSLASELIITINFQLTSEERKDRNDHESSCSDEFHLRSIEFLVLLSLQLKLEWLLEAFDRALYETFWIVILEILVLRNIYKSNQYGMREKQISYCVMRSKNNFTLPFS